MQLSLEQTNVLYAIVRNAEAQVRALLGVEIILEFKLGGNPNVKADMLLPVIADALRIDPSYYTNHTRTTEAVTLRFVAAHIIKAYFPRTKLVEMAKWFGDKDHSTVSYMLRQANTLLGTRDVFFTENYIKAKQAVEAYVR